MTMEEVHAKLVEELEDEIDSAVEYHQMALTMEDHGCGECFFLMQIAKDEMSHAKWIHDYAHRRGLPIAEEVEKRYKELEMAHK